DVQAAQLLLAPDEAEIERLVSGYGDRDGYISPLAELDSTRAQLVKELSRLQPGESTQPLMEQFVPALWPAAKAAVAILGRKKLVRLIGGMLKGPVAKIIGAEGANLLAPAIADAGLRIFGLETTPPPPRAMLAEALAASIEETVNTVAEL